MTFSLSLEKISGSHLLSPAQECSLPEPPWSQFLVLLLLLVPAVRSQCSCENRRTPAVCLKLVFIVIQKLFMANKTSGSLLCDSSDK